MSPIWSSFFRGSHILQSFVELRVHSDLHKTFNQFFKSLLKMSNMKHSHQLDAFDLPMYGGLGPAAWGSTVLSSLPLLLFLALMGIGVILLPPLPSGLKSYWSWCSEWAGIWAPSTFGSCAVRLSSATQSSVFWLAQVLCLCATHILAMITSQPFQQLCTLQDLL